jgi:hypothetical protein
MSPVSRSACCIEYRPQLHDLAPLCGHFTHRAPPLWVKAEMSRALDRIGTLLELTEHARSRQQTARRGHSAAWATNLPA